MHRCKKNARAGGEANFILFNAKRGKGVKSLYYEITELKQVTNDGGDLMEKL